MSDVWNPAFASLHPAFDQLPIQDWRGWLDWPDCACLTGQLPAGMHSQGGPPICFLPQDVQIPFPELYYEQRIFHHGIVSTRANWHDFFNANIWSLFPQSKIAINARHEADMQGQQGKKRTPQRDALTMLDESGVILVSSRRSWLEQVKAFEWGQVFGIAPVAWGCEVECFLFGHAMMEKLLTPYVGMTAHALLVEVGEGFFALDKAEQRSLLDRCIARTLYAGGLMSPLWMNPFPVLGVPGWWPQQDREFYENTDYFRAKSRVREVEILAL